MPYKFTYIHKNEKYTNNMRDKIKKINTQTYIIYKIENITPYSDIGY